MKCKFCEHEVAEGTTECPYCHYRFQVDPKVLSAEERDTFEGVTIDEGSGTAEEPQKVERTDSYTGSSGGGYYDERQQAPQIKVHSFGCGSSLLMTLLILCGVVALFFFLLPTFIVFAAVAAIVIFVLRLFM